MIAQCLNRKHLVLMRSMALMACLCCGLAVVAWAGPPQVQRQELKNGLKLLFVEQHGLPFITFHLVIDAGSWRDPQGQGGLANLTAEGLLLGTASHTAGALNRQIDYLGADLSTDCGRDYAALDLKILKKDWLTGMDLYLDIIMRPAFPDKEIGRKMREIAGYIQSSEDQPMDVAEKAFHRALFTYVPYGHPVEGSAESLSGLSRSKVEDFYRSYYLPNNAFLVIVGDLTHREIEKELLPRLDQWRRASVPTENVTDVFAPEPADVKLDRPVAQASIILGNPGIARSNQDFFAVITMNEILGGGGFSSRLLKQIRVQGGLAYSASSFFDPRRFPGSFQIVLQTKNSSAREAIGMAHDVMQKMQQAPVSQQELDTAKDYLISSFPMRYDSQSKLASLLGHIAYYNLGDDYFTAYPERVRAVNQEDVLNAARTYLMPDKSITCVVANLKEAGLQ